MLFQELKIDYLPKMMNKHLIMLIIIYTAVLITGSMAVFFEVLGRRYIFSCFDCNGQTVTGVGKNCSL